MPTAAICIVRTKVQADAIVHQLEVSGFFPGDISVLYPSRDGTAALVHERHTKAPEGGAAGAGIGGLVGGALGLLAGLGAISLPGLGPFLAVGPVMAALGGIGAGATIGGLVGALVGCGIPEYEARRYDKAVRRTNVMVAVHTEDTEQRLRAKHIFQDLGASSISTVSESPAAVPAPAPEA